MQSYPPVHYRIKTASATDVLEHLKACNHLFIPPLSEKVALPEYAEKIEQRAVTFEAWIDEKLAGLVAAYFNDRVSGRGYITSVSVVPQAGGKGIATRLMGMTDKFAEENNFREIWLEVHKDNHIAAQLYIRCGFTALPAGNNNETVHMKKIIQQPKHNENKKI